MEVLNGNLESQKILYDKYKKVIRDFIKYRYSNITDIDDDISEIMIKVFFKLKTFDESKSQFKSWVLSIAKNHMIDKWRGNALSCSTYNNIDVENFGFSGYDDYEVTQVSNFNQIDSTLTNCATFSSNSSTYFGNIEIDNCTAVNYISKNISAEEYALLDMKYVQGYNYKEIGLEFNMTSSTVSNKVNYLKTKLKRIMLNEVNS